MDMFDLASALFGSRRAEDTNTVSNSVDTITAIGATDSENGSTGVVFDADVTAADDYDGDDTIIDIPTSPTVVAGDDVMVSLVGDGPLKAPMVIANPGSGDRMQSEVDSAASAAAAAQAIAEATGQHFWDDANGAHVTQVTQDEWNDAGDPNYHSGPNSLWNSLGMLFRDGLTNLLAVLTTGLAIYDGLGNAAGNIVAEFTASKISLMRDYFTMWVGGTYGNGPASIINAVNALVIGAGDPLDPDVPWADYEAEIDVIAPVSPNTRGTIRIGGYNVFHDVDLVTSYADDYDFYVDNDPDGIGYYSFTSSDVVRAIAHASPADTWSSVTGANWIQLNAGWSIQSSTLVYNALRKRFVGYLQVRATASHSAGNNSLGTVASSYRPPARIIINTTTNGAYKIYVDGSGAATIVLGSAATNGTDYYLAMDYAVS